MGKQEGFNNLENKKIHDVGSKVMQSINLAIHENVPQYNEDE